MSQRRGTSPQHTARRPLKPRESTTTSREFCLFAFLLRLVVVLKQQPVRTSAMQSCSLLPLTLLVGRPLCCPCGSLRLFQLPLGMARARRVPLLLVKGPTALELHLDLLARLWEKVLLELLQRHYAVAVLRGMRGWYVGGSRVEETGYSQGSEVQQAAPIELVTAKKVLSPAGDEKLVPLVPPCGCRPQGSTPQSGQSRYTPCQSS